MGNKKPFGFMFHQPKAQIHSRTLCSGSVGWSGYGKMSSIQRLETLAWVHINAPASFAALKPTGLGRVSGMPAIRLTCAALAAMDVESNPFPTS